MTASTPLVFAAAAIATVDVWLIVIAVHRQVVLAGFVGVLGLAIVAFAATRGLRGGAAHGAVAIALVFVIIGAALLGLGRVLDSLLDHPSDDWDT